MCVFFKPEEEFVDSKEKVYNAMKEILECLLDVFNHPQRYVHEEEDMIHGYVKQAESVIERANKLEEN